MSSWVEPQQGVLGFTSLVQCLQKGYIVYESPNTADAPIEACGIRVHLDEPYWVCTPGLDELVVGESNPYRFFQEQHAQNHPEGFLRIKPFGFILAQTVEAVGSTVPWLLPRISGLSTNARWGCGVELAGDGSPGWRAQWTLEIVNSTPRTMLLRAGMPIALISFHTVVGNTQLYHGRYLHESGMLPRQQRRRYQDEEGGDW